MNPLPGVRITLISPQTMTPYSGMLPGLIAGHYSFEQTHIDLVKLALWANIRFIQDKVIAIDVEAKTLAKISGSVPLNITLLCLFFN
jgi:selenide,water dikinase